VSDACVGRVRRYGDAGLLVETPSNGAALALCAALAASGLAVRARPGLRSVLVQPSGGDADLGALARAVADLPVGDSAPPPGRVVELPVVYDGEDLSEVAARTGLDLAEVVARHAAPEYTVACLGFTAGFAYLEGLDEALHLPRRDSPRARVPAGSVAIAGNQAGVYPRPAPGGWHLIGRTAAVVFDEAADPPALLAPGDRVRFLPVAP
jgi:KipI family sensor histidine kinase inhibitor